MIRAPWWAIPAAFAAGVLAAFMWPGPSDAAMDELRNQRDSAQARTEVAEAAKDSAVAVADSSHEAHAAHVVRTDSTIARLTARVQTTTARATTLGDSVRAMVGEEAAGLVSELEAEWEATVEAERAQKGAWRARALSAEAGWRDERLARVALERQVVAMQDESRAQDALVRALESEIRRARLEKRVLALAGVAGVAWGLTR